MTLIATNLLFVGIELTGIMSKPLTTYSKKEEMQPYKKERRNIRNVSP